MRKLIYIALLVLAIAGLGVLAFLGPAHLQIRGITPALPDVAELLALRDVADGPVSLESLTVATQEYPRGTGGHAVFLARWADGRAFMIDAGMDRAQAADFAELMATLGGAGEARFLGDVAEQLGPTIRDVSGVGFTHLHIDHTQGLGVFCAARGSGATVYQTRWQAEVHNRNTTAGAAIVRDSCLTPAVIDGEGLHPVDGFPGLGMVALGGHTPGSTLFALAVDDRLWLFSGDITNSKADLLADVGKGFLYSAILVPENTARTAELRRWLTSLDARDDTTVIVSHDIQDTARHLPAFDAAESASTPPTRESLRGR